MHLQVRSLGPTAVARAQLRLLVPAKARVAGRLVTLLRTYVLVDRRRVDCKQTDLEEGQGLGQGDLLLGVDGLPGSSASSSEGEARDDWEDLQDGGGPLGGPLGGLRCGVEPVVCVELLCPLPGSTLGSAGSVDLRSRLLTDTLSGLLGTARAVAVRTKAVVVLPGLEGLPADSKIRYCTSYTPRQRDFQG